jgi:hypothetical protein
LIFISSCTGKEQADYNSSGLLLQKAFIPESESNTYLNKPLSVGFRKEL